MRSQLYIIFQPKNYLKNGMFVILRGNFTLKFLKKMISIYRLILTFVMNGQDNEYIKSVKFSYTNKENTANILDDLCAGSYEDEFRDSWIGWRNMNMIITNVVRNLDILKK